MSASADCPEALSARPTQAAQVSPVLFQLFGFFILLLFGGGIVSAHLRHLCNDAVTVVWQKCYNCVTKQTNRNPEPFPVRGRIHFGLIRVYSFSKSSAEDWPWSRTTSKTVLKPCCCVKKRRAPSGSPPPIKPAML